MGTHVQADPQLEHEIVQRAKHGAAGGATYSDSAHLSSFPLYCRWIDAQLTKYNANSVRQAHG
jgi:hypothetical protein